MTTVKDDETDQISKDLEDETAAFEASFEGSDVAAKPEKASKPESAEVKMEEEMPPVTKAPEEKQEAVQSATNQKADDAAPTAPSQKADDPDLRAEVRKLHGRIGALNDQLQQALKSKETEGKPAVLSTVQLTRLKAEYPEMADVLEGDIAEVIRDLAQKATDPKEIENMVSQRVSDEIFNMRQEAIADRHETWMTDLWADQPGGTRTPEYQAWINTMTKDEAHAFENSQNPAFVNRKLDQFYDWKSKTVKAETEKQQRLKAALTPQGTARAGPQTMSDEEAERKAFEDAYNQ